MTKLVWLLGSLGAVSLTALQGCADDDEPAQQTAGMGGSSGNGGSTTTAGSTNGGSTNGGSTNGGTSSAGGMTGGNGGTTLGGSSGAGGGGAGEREAPCAEYCAVYIANCATAAANSYDDENDCNMTCVAADWGLVGMSGNTVYCRIYHAQSAAELPDMAEAHCGHAAAESTELCVD